MEGIIGGWCAAVAVGGALAIIEADPAPLFEAVGTLMKLFEAAVEGLSLIHI